MADQDVTVQFAALRVATIAGEDHGLGKLLRYAVITIMAEPPIVAAIK